MGVIEAIRDVVVILVALAALAANIALIVLVLKLWGMVKALREEVSPVLGSLTHTSNTVRETTSLIGELVIEPLARAAGLANGFLTLVRALTTIGRGGRRQGADRVR